jgi:hypothetical protein
MPDSSIINKIGELMAHPPALNLSRLQEADDFYNNLLAKGIIKKRGYTLMGIEDSSKIVNIGLNKPAESVLYKYTSNI